MNYCLRCNKPCLNLSPSGSEVAVFCDECRSLLRKRLPVGNKAETPKDFDLLHTSLWQEGHEIEIASLADGEPAPNAQGRAESIPTFGTFANWRSQGPFATLPRVESFPQPIPSVQIPLTTPHNPDSSSQYEIPTPSQEREGEQDTRPRPPGARPQQEVHGRNSNGWTNHADPLTARLGTHILPAPATQKETGSRRSIPVPQTGRSRPYARYVAIALVVLTILVVGVLVFNGAVLMGIIQQHDAKISASSPMLNATMDTTPQTAPTAQLTPSLSPSPSLSLSPSPSPGAGKPATTTSAGAGSPTPGTTASATPTSPSAVESVSASSLSFNATQGQANPSGQAVNIVNTGDSSLNWQASVGSSWLGVTPDKGAVVAGQSEQMTVKVNIAGLTPGSYNAQITVSATDSSGMRIQGSPQTLSVTLTIAQPCSLQVSPSSLSFTASTLQLSSPPGKDITLKEVGNCARPVSWRASADQRWIILSATSGTDNGSGSTITVQAKTSILNTGNYQGQITLSAAESGGDAVQGSPQTVSVTVSVTSLL